MAAGDFVHAAMAFSDKLAFIKHICIAKKNSDMNRPKKNVGEKILQTRFEGRSQQSKDVWKNIGPIFPLPCSCLTFFATLQKRLYMRHRNLSFQNWQCEHYKKPSTGYGKPRKHSFGWRMCSLLSNELR